MNTTTRSMELKNDWLKITDDLVRHREKRTVNRSPDYWKLLENLFAMGRSPFWSADYILDLMDNLNAGK